MTERWRREVAAVFEGGVGRDRAGARARAVRRGVQPAARPRSTRSSTAWRWTSGARRYATFDDLYEYCIRVASAVGLMCVEIFGYREPRAREYATELGVALQLTNILRDVPVDLADGPRVPAGGGPRIATDVAEADLQREVSRGRARRAIAGREGAAAAAGRPRARVLRRAPPRRCRARTRAGWSRPRSWARSTAACSTASKRATTTSSPPSFGSRARGGR